MAKIAIYTCITGGYDTLRQPAAIWPEADYICFVPQKVPAPSVMPGSPAVMADQIGHPGSTGHLGEGIPAQGGYDKTGGYDGVWRLRSFACDAPGDVLQSRYPKINPHLVLPDYEYSLWMDGNTTVADASLYDILKAKMDSGIVYSGLCHPLRDCIYDEALRCLQTGRISLPGYLKTVLRLKLNGFKTHQGLTENNVIFRKHNCPEVVRMDELWWKLLLGGPLRDQLFFVYAMQKAGVKLDYLLPKEFCSRNHPAFGYYPHEKK